MKAKIILSVFAVTVSTILLCAFHSPEVLSPCDAPLVGDHSGAPGETNCTACHAGTNNSGTGTITLDVGGGMTDYVPGQTYICTVTVSQTNTDKMGFCCLALQNSNNTSIGSFSLIDPTRTRLYTLGSRNYCSHNPCGADALSLGFNQWTFNWTAPSTNAGNVTLYLGALATNHNHATSGDYAYTRSVTLSPSATSINEIPYAVTNFSVFPVPASEQFTVSFENLSEEKLQLSVCDLQGRVIKILSDENLPQGKISKSFSIQELGLNVGIYFISIQKSGMKINQKLTIL
jgi:hypothetical protein